VLAELIVAGFIWREAETNRRSHFYETTTKDERNKDRAEVYRQYLQLPGTDISRRSKAFTALMYNSEPVEGKEDFKRQCDRQIELFNGLGLIVSPWLTREKGYIRIFPHAAIYIWIIMHDYIIQRRQDAGGFFAEPMLRFTLKCAKFLIKRDRSIRLRRHDSQPGLELTVEDLKRTRDQIKTELKRQNPKRFAWVRKIRTA
jgi:hypothetical protein